MCTSPLKGFIIGVDAETGKQQLFVTSRECRAVEFRKDRWFGVTSLDSTSFFSKVVTKYVMIGCGQCMECRLKRAREWADRCVCESMYHEQSLFLTLTYDDAHVPVSAYVDDDGVVNYSLTLRKKDLQDFMKRLRDSYIRKCGKKLRFYACGEYGESTFRPHYHVIVFGLLLDDLLPYRKNFRGESLFTSSYLTGIWKNGHVVIGNVSWDACAYTARYITKKQLGKDAQKNFYERLNIVPEFTQMSLKPGIGYQFFEDHPEMMKYGQIELPGEKKSRTIKPGRYYERLYELEYPEESRDRRQSLISSIEAKNAVLRDELALSEEEYYKIRECSLKSKLAALPRNKIKEDFL
uniref:Replication initiator protein n=1 Tax=Dulem virus 117 TaxID=3145594 RepID=A0AAU8B1K3_9VIRU